MGDKTKAIEGKIFHEAYRHKKTNIYRVFLNLPIWVGMKVFEITKDGVSVKWDLIAECIYQGNNHEVAKLYSEVSLIQVSDWIKLDSAESLIKCIECAEKHCATCEYF